MLTLATNSLQQGHNDTLQQQLENLAAKGYVPQQKIRAILQTAWECGVYAFLSDSVLSPEEESLLSDFKNRFQFTPDELDVNGALTRVVKAGVIRDLIAGNIPQRVNIEGPLPFRPLSDEILIWLFKSADYFEQRTQRRYEGRSSGVSIRIVRGVYYRVGAFQGHPVDTRYLAHIDSGWLGVTDKNVYFAGQSKTLRIPHSKIIGLTTFSDGVGIDRDALSAKRQLFRTGDGWFTYNLLANIPTSSDQRRDAVPPSTSVEAITAEDEELVEKSLEIIRQEKRASTSLLQRRLRLGYTRAARIIAILEQRGILAPGEGAKPREILVDID